MTATPNRFRVDHDALYRLLSEKMGPYPRLSRALREAGLPRHRANRDKVAWTEEDTYRMANWLGALVEEFASPITPEPTRSCEVPMRLDLPESIRGPLTAMARNRRVNGKQYVMGILKAAAGIASARLQAEADIAQGEEVKP